MSHFNYIVTCHNSEALIERVWSAVAGARRMKTMGGIYFVCDGCTDGTEAVVDHACAVDFTSHKVVTSDVHELLSINAGLRATSQEGDGFNIILQDDVILEDPDLESKIETLYRTIPRLGYISLRLGFNIGSAELTPGGYFSQADEIESAYGAGVCEDVLLPGRFVPRTVPIKSPVCLPCKLVRELGMFNEALAPYAYDDLEYAIRSTMAGYQNGVFSIPFRSNLMWGGTRKPGHPDIQPIARRNAAYIAECYAKELRFITEHRGQPTETYILQSSMPEEEAALKRWAESRALLKSLNP